MEKTDKIIIAFYVILAVSYPSWLAYSSDYFGIEEVPENIRLLMPAEYIERKNTYDVSKEKIFDVMANPENYPKALPRNVISVNIINQTGNEIFAEYEIAEAGISTKVLAKHTLEPSDRHTIEVLNGDAKGTKIIVGFSEKNSQTVLYTQVYLELKGLLSPFAYLPANNLIHATSTVMDSFVMYAKGFDNKHEKIVDDLYREILLRPADTEGLDYYASLLEQDKMSVSQIRQELENSEEKKNLLKPTEIKPVSELKEETKKIVDELYLEILNRNADERGLSHYGSLLEGNKITVDELREILLNSDERKSLQD